MPKQKTHTGAKKRFKMTKKYHLMALLLLTKRGKYDIIMLYS